MNVVINDFVDFEQSGPLKKRYRWFTEVARFDSGVEQRNQVMSRPVRSWDMNWAILDATERDNLIELFQRAKGKYDTFLYEDSDDYEATCAFTQAQVAIVSASTGDATFTVSGDLATEFETGVKFAITGTASNDGDYVCTADATSDGTDTILYVAAVPADQGASGYLLRKEFQLFAPYYEGESETWSEDRKDIQPDEISVTVAGGGVTEGVEYTLDDNTGIIIFEDTYAPADGEVISATFKYYFRVRFDIDLYEDVMKEVDLYSNNVPIVEVIT